MSPDFILLYVSDSARSAQFYGALLGREPVDARPGFVMYVLDNGLRLGLWGSETVDPAPTAPGGSEMGWPVDSESEVDRLAEAWAARGIAIVQQPTTMGFGRTFTALDPDGHRLRVYRPALRG